MANIKMSDLGFGSLNNIQDGNSGKSGDRRRTTATRAIRMAVETAFAKNTLNNITEFNGVVVSFRPISYPSYSNKTALFEEYLIKSGSEGGDTNEKPQKYATFAYKVYIPELEPRPAPISNNDPVLVTYPDVYCDIEGYEFTPLELGTLVSVKYEDVENLFNPRIVRKVGGPIQIENVASEELNEKFKQGIPAALGSRGDAVQYPVEPARIYEPSFFNPSAYKNNLASQINSLDKSVQEKFALAVKEFVETYFNEGLDIQISYGYRSLAKQDELGRSTSGPVAKPGASWHNYGAAIDILIYDRNLQKFDEDGGSDNYQNKAKSIFLKYGLVNDIENDGGHFYPQSFGKAPSEMVRKGEVKLESLLA